MKIKSILLLIILFNLSKSQDFIDQTYYFIGPDEMHIYRQSNDTLYNYTSYSIQEPKKIDRIRMHFKILENKKLDSNDNVYTLKMERLDSIPLTTDSFPEDRFKILIYKKLDNEIILLDEKNGLTKSQIGTYKTDTIKYKNNFGLVYYSQNKMNEFSKLKKIKTKNDVKIISNEMNNPKYLLLAEDYRKNIKIPDGYASGLIATIINKSCIETGYSPIGAGVLMNILNSDRFSEIEKKNMVKEYYEKINPE